MTSDRLEEDDAHDPRWGREEGATGFVARSDDGYHRRCAGGPDAGYCGARATHVAGIEGSSSGLVPGARGAHRFFEWFCCGNRAHQAGAGELPRSRLVPIKDWLDDLARAIERSQMEDRAREAAVILNALPEDK